jgi:hypothetical protein
MHRQFLWFIFVLLWASAAALQGQELRVLDPTMQIDGVGVQELVHTADENGSGPAVAADSGSDSSVSGMGGSRGRG